MGRLVGVKPLVVGAIVGVEPLVVGPIVGVEPLVVGGTVGVEPLVVGALATPACAALIKSATVVARVTPVTLSADIL
jgi:hypothetical protein